MSLFELTNAISIPEKNPESNNILRIIIPFVLILIKSNAKVLKVWGLLVYEFISL